MYCSSICCVYIYTHSINVHVNCIEWWSQFSLPKITYIKRGSCQVVNVNFTGVLMQNLQHQLVFGHFGIIVSKSEGGKVKEYWSFKWSGGIDSNFPNLRRYKWRTDLISWNENICEVQHRRTKQINYMRLK